MITTHGFIKHTEEDDYNEGANPDSSEIYSDEQMRLSANDEKGILEQIKSFLGVDDDAIEVNACGEKGRIDVQMMEDENGTQPSKEQMRLFKLGKCRLWIADYTFYAVDERVHVFTER